MKRTGEPVADLPFKLAVVEGAVPARKFGFPTHRLTQRFNHEIRHKSVTGRVTGNLAFGNKVKVFLQSTIGQNDVRILVLDGVMGYIDLTQKSDPVAYRTIDVKGGYYFFDLSLRLSRRMNPKWTADDRPF